MASLGMTFNPDDAEDVSFEDLQPGDYPAEVFDTDVKATKAGTGNILAVQWRVTDGDSANGRIFQNINFLNNSAEAQRIGQGQLKQICKAIGLEGHMENSEELHGGQAIIVVGMSKAQNGYPARAEVKGVKALNAAPPAGKATASVAPPRPAPQQAQRTAAPAAVPSNGAAPGRRPWANRGAAANG